MPRLRRESSELSSDAKRGGTATRRDVKTWVQAVLIGDMAFVGVPGEFFTMLGQEIKRRSPFRYTYVFELANDYIGYIPDQAGFDRGGYQTWTGLHSFLDRGTGEKIVDEASDCWIGCMVRNRRLRISDQLISPKPSLADIPATSRLSQDIASSGPMGSRVTPKTNDRCLSVA